MLIWVNCSSAGTGHSTSPSLSVHETWKIGPWSSGSVWVPGREGVKLAELCRAVWTSYKLIELDVFFDPSGIHDSFMKLIRPIVET
jgi:hypothetical protein